MVASVGIRNNNNTHKKHLFKNIGTFSFIISQIYPDDNRFFDRKEIFMERGTMNSKQLDGILNAVSGKLGVTPKELENALKSGKIDKAVRNMPNADRQKLQSVMGNQAQLEKLMQSPQARALYEKLTGKSPQ